MTAGFWVGYASGYGFTDDVGSIWDGLDGAYNTPPNYFNLTTYQSVTTTATQTPQSLGYSDCTLLGYVKNTN
jgi:hypothetical protein